MSVNITTLALHALVHHGVAFRVFGAVALNLHGIARGTEDLDIFVAPTEDNIARLKRALAAVFDDPSIAEIDAGELAGEYPAVQYVPPEGEFHIDILTVSARRIDTRTSPRCCWMSVASSCRS